MAEQQRTLRDVSTIRDAPPLNDIVGQLRAMADQIEAAQKDQDSEYSDVMAAYLVLIHDDAFEPDVYLWGKVEMRHGLAGIFMHCAKMALTDREDD